MPLLLFFIIMENILFVMWWSLSSLLLLEWNGITSSSCCPTLCVNIRIVSPRQPSKRNGTNQVITPKALLKIWTSNAHSFLSISCRGQLGWRSTLMMHKLTDSLGGSVIPSVPRTCWVSHVPTLGNRTDNDDDDRSILLMLIRTLHELVWQFQYNEKKTFDNVEAFTFDDSTLEHIMDTYSPPYSISKTHMYHVSKHSSSHYGSLIDRGANGGLAG